MTARGSESFTGEETEDQIGHFPKVTQVKRGEPETPGCPFSILMRGALLVLLGMVYPTELATGHAVVYIQVCLTERCGGKEWLA